MTISIHHKNRRDIICHYMSPLHLFAPVIRSALRTHWRLWRIVLFAVVSAYDGLYRNVMRCSLTTKANDEERKQIR